MARKGSKARKAARKRQGRVGLTRKAQRNGKRFAKTDSGNADAAPTSDGAPSDLPA